MTSNSVLEIVEREIRDIKPFRPERIIICSTPTAYTVASEAFRDLDDTPLLLIPIHREFDKQIHREFAYAEVLQAEHQEVLIWTNIDQEQLTAISDGLENWITKKTKLLYLLTTLENSFEEAVLYKTLSSFKQDQRDLKKILIVLLPPKVESSSMLFNAYTWLHRVLDEKLTDMVLLLDREKTESCEGLNIYGEPLKGLRTLSYALRLIAERDSGIQGYLNSTAKLDANVHMPLLSLGNSLDIYESVQNVLKASTSRPLVNFDQLRAKTLYVIPEIPSNLRDTLTVNRLKSELSKWINEMKLDPLFWDISEPIVKDVETMRISLVNVLGGIDPQYSIRHIAEGYAEFKEMASSKDMVGIE